MVALAGAFGLFHFAQQRVHLGDAQRVVGAHCGVAGNGSEQLVAPLGKRA